MIYFVEFRWNVVKHVHKCFYSIIQGTVFYRFGQAIVFPDGGSVLGLSQFAILPQLPTKIQLDSKVVKIDPKIIPSLVYKIRDTLCR